jgi:V-type H+-transporting ATPase subunit E
VQNRILRSTEIGDCRIKKMKVRDALLQQLISEATTKCVAVANGTNYPQLVQKLIVQGLIKIEENTIEIYCRTKDVSIVTKVLPAAVAEYVSIMARESGVTLQPVVTMNQDRTRDLTDSVAGGIVLTALNGHITCDNTLQSRWYTKNYSPPFVQSYSPKMHKTIYSMKIILSRKEAGQRYEKTYLGRRHLKII